VTIHEQVLSSLLPSTSRQLVWAAVASASRAKQRCDSRAQDPLIRFANSVRSASSADKVAAE
jgi:hypothetical protein